MESEIWGKAAKARVFSDCAFASDTHTLEVETRETRQVISSTVSFSFLVLSC